MDTTEVEVLLIENNLAEAEKMIHILRGQNLANKLIQLKDGKEAGDFIFCKGVFSKRNIQHQPKSIFFNIKREQPQDELFLKKISTHKRTKNIPLVVFYC